MKNPTEKNSYSVEDFDLHQTVISDPIFIGRVKNPTEQIQVAAISRNVDVYSLIENPHPDLLQKAGWVFDFKSPYDLPDSIKFSLPNITLVDKLNFKIELSPAQKEELYIFGYSFLDGTSIKDKTIDIKSKLLTSATLSYCPENGLVYKQPNVWHDPETNQKTIWNLNVRIHESNFEYGLSEHEYMGSDFVQEQKVISFDLSMSSIPIQ